MPLIKRADSSTNKSETKEKPEQTIEKIPIYNVNQFSINQPDGWNDITIYTFAGPLDDNIQHNIIIQIDNNVKFDSLEEYANMLTSSLERDLNSCRILSYGEISLANGLPAYRAIFRWQPTDELLLYQEQMFVLVHNTGYRLTATFTRKTRKTLGPLVGNILRSFEPKTQKFNGKA
jgi:hypothetical protein